MELDGVKPEPQPRHATDQQQRRHQHHQQQQQERQPVSEPHPDDTEPRRTSPLKRRKQTATDGRRSSGRAANDALEDEADEDGGEGGEEDDPFQLHADTDIEKIREEERRVRAEQAFRIKAIDNVLDRPEYKPILQNPRDEAFARTLNQLNTIQKEIGRRDVSNALLDASVLNKLAAHGVAMAHGLNAMITINVDEMLNKFVEHYGMDEEDEAEGHEEEAAAGRGRRRRADPSAADRGGRDIDWFKFGEDVYHRFRSVHCTSFMKGILGLQPVVKERKKKRATRRSHSEDEDEPVARADIATGPASKEATTMTGQRVSELWRHLPIQPSPFFEILIHPTSFTQSVENLFDLTFLIKKGQAEVSIDKELGIPLVRRLGTAAGARLASASAAAAADGDMTLDDMGEDEASNFQCIIKMTMQEWKDIVKAYKITRPHIDREVGVSGEEESKQPSSGGAAPRPLGRSRAITTSSSAAVPDFFSPSQPTLFHEPTPKRSRTKKSSERSHMDEDNEEGDAADEDDAFYA